MIQNNTQQDTPQALTRSKNPTQSKNLSLEHRELLDGAWWQERIPAWKDVSEEDFRSGRWQLRNSVTSVDALLKVLGDHVDEGFGEDLHKGLGLAPMQLRLTPYLISLIDWRQAKLDPIRRQFLPLASEGRGDHPMGRLDSLGEQRDSVAPGLTHRYPDKVLLLALDVCPVYCRFCTRSYAVGADTEEVDKLSFGASRRRWSEALEYIAKTPTVEDVVISGGDAWLLSANKLRSLGEELLAIPHIRRFRVASKGLAVLPQKILTDEPWLEALTDIREQATRQGVEVALHTHANHPAELTSHTALAMDRLRERGVIVRNQAVLQHGVNDDPEVMKLLVKRLSWLGIQPYYVYTHDMVPGVEALRTSLSTAIDLEKQIRGVTAGFNTPTFVCDTYGGGGKRGVHSYEHYDRELGVAVYGSPVVDASKPYFYFDPLHELSPKVQQAWQDPERRRRLMDTVIERAGFGDVS
ncbi:MAG: lysine 2,3-aminomutase [Cognaticolwellia sp.]|jgi:lysine 2,3-aminomutase